MSHTEVLRDINHLNKSAFSEQNVDQHEKPPRSTYSHPRTKYPSSAESPSGSTIASMVEEDITQSTTLSSDGSSRLRSESQPLDTIENSLSSWSPERTPEIQFQESRPAMVPDNSNRVEEYSSLFLSPEIFTTAVVSDEEARPLVNSSQGPPSHILPKMRGSESEERLVHDIHTQIAMMKEEEDYIYTMIEQQEALERRVLESSLEEDRKLVYSILRRQESLEERVKRFIFEDTETGSDGLRLSRRSSFITTESGGSGLISSSPLTLELRPDAVSNKDHGAAKEKPVTKAEDNQSLRKSDGPGDESTVDEDKAEPHVDTLHMSEMFMGADMVDSPYFSTMIQHDSAMAHYYQDDNDDGNLPAILLEKQASEEDQCGCVIL